MWNVKLTECPSKFVIRPLRMVELTVNAVLRRSAAVLRKQQSVTRFLSWQRPHADVRQTCLWQKKIETAGTVTRIDSDRVPRSILDPVESAEDLKAEGAPVVCELESEKKEQRCREDVGHHITHIIANGEDIDALQEGIARRLPSVEEFTEIELQVAVATFAETQNFHPAQVLYLFDNRLGDVDCLELWPQLRKVYLQNNLIRSLRKSFDNLPSLEELNLDRNRIQRLEGLTRCSRLTRLSLSCQQTVMPLAFVDKSLRALSKSLRFLNISHNKVHDLRPIAVLEMLESLDASANDVWRLDVIGDVLAGCRHLKTLNLSNNPVSSTPTQRQYIRYILLHASKELCELDGKEVASVQREFVQDMHRYLSGNQRQSSQVNSGPQKSEQF